MWRTPRARGRASGPGRRAASYGPREERLSLEKRQKLDMRKREVAKVLLTKRAATYARELSW